MRVVVIADFLGWQEKWVKSLEGLGVLGLKLKELGFWLGESWGTACSHRCWRRRGTQWKSMAHGGQLWSLFPGMAQMVFAFSECSVS